MAPETNQSPFRIAVLLADTPVPAVLQELGDYGQIFRTLFTKALSRAGGAESSLQWSQYDTVTKMEYPNLEDVDGILITGSKHNAFDNDPWILKLTEFTAQALATDRIRVIGVCFGHQILGRALGSPVTRSDSWEVSVCDVDLSAKGKEIFGLPKLAIQQMHRDIVTRLPEGAELLGGSPTCEIQGMYRPQRYISVQGHPEFTGQIVRDIVDVRHAAGLFDDQTSDEYKQRAEQHHDGVTIAESFIKFLHE